MTETDLDEDNLEDGKLINVRIGGEMLDWMDKQIKKHRFNNKSHALRYCCAYVMNVHPENVGNGD